MDLIVALDYDDPSRKAATRSAADTTRPDCNMVLRAEDTPMGLYRELIERT